VKNVETGCLASVLTAYEQSTVTGRSVDLHLFNGESNCAEVIDTSGWRKPCFGKLVVFMTYWWNIRL